MFKLLHLQALSSFKVHFLFSVMAYWYIIFKSFWVASRSPQVCYYHWVLKKQWKYIILWPI